MESTKDMIIEEPTSSVEAPTSSQETPTSEIPTHRIHECSDGKQRNEEQYKAWKHKKEQFEKDPDLFVHLDDIVMAVITNGQGRACVFGKFSIEDCKSAIVTLQHRFFNALTEFEYAQKLKKADKAIVGADGKPMDNIII